MSGLSPSTRLTKRMALSPSGIRRSGVSIDVPGILPSETDRRFYERKTPLRAALGDSTDPASWIELARPATTRAFSGVL